MTAIIRMVFPMGYYPINLRLSGKKAVVIGGGAVALQKIRGLLEAGAVVTVIAPHLNPAVRALEEAKKIRVDLRNYQEGDLEGATVVFGATNHPEIHRRIHQEALLRKIPFNAVDQPEECDFIVPSKVKRGSLLLTVSTEGRAPFLSKALRKKLEGLFGAEYEILLDLLARLRNFLKDREKTRELASFFEREESRLLKILRERDQNSLEALLRHEWGNEISLQKLGFKIE